MKLQNVILGIIVLFLMSCGGEKKERPSYNSKTVKKEAVKEVKETPKKTVKKEETKTGMVDLNNKGIGPIKSLTLGAIDNSMAEAGKLIFKNKCSSCHRVNRKFIGPNPTGILERRSPEWVMNMILNPEEMVKKDPVAKQLLIDYNGSPMANQNLTEDEARKVLEYFRTLK